MIEMKNRLLKIEVGMEFELDKMCFPYLQPLLNEFDLDISQNNDKLIIKVKNKGEKFEEPLIRFYK